MKHEQEIRQFDTWISSHYECLQSYCNKYHIPEDILNNAYIKMKDRIVRSGYTSTQYMTYVKTTIGNLQKNEQKKWNNKFFVDVEDEDFENTIEDKLLNDDEDEKATQQYREDVMYFSMMLFKYIMYEKKYDDEWQFVFRSYYLMPQRFTYKKLTAATGYNKNHCTKIIQTMKSDIKENFINWLKDEQRRNNRIDE